MLSCLAKKYKVSACFFEALSQNPKIVLKAKSEFLVLLSFTLIGDFLHCTFKAGFRNNFQDHRQLS
jgi:hypothetical protein